MLIYDLKGRYLDFLYSNYVIDCVSEEYDSCSYVYINMLPICAVKLPLVSVIPEIRVCSEFFGILRHYSQRTFLS